MIYGLHSPSESPTLVANFVEQTGISYTVMADQNYTKGSFAFPPGSGFPYPRDVVIGKDLTIRLIKSSFDVAEMDQLIQRLLNEP